jgi:hypothetical protein
MPHRPEVRLRDDTAHIESRPDGDSVELEPGLCLHGVTRKEGRGSVQGHHVAQMALHRVQVAVLVEILGVGAAVARRAVRPGITDEVDLAGRRQARLVPRPELVPRRIPDLAEARIRLLVQAVEAPVPSVFADARGGAAGVDEEGVLADRPQIDHEGDVLVAIDVELEELGLGEVEPVGGQ